MNRILLLVIGGLAACGTSSNAPGTSDPFTGCTTYYAALRTQLQGCPGGAGVAGQFLSDSAIQYTCTTLAARATAGTVVLDPAQLTACLAAVQALGCALVRQTVHPLACEKIFTGTVAAGGSCTLATECVNGGYCLQTFDSAGRLRCPGACVARNGIGAPCSLSHDCQAGLICPSGQCTDQRAALGASCMQDNDCVDGAFCDSFASLTAQCRAYVPAGGACMFSEPCVVGSACLHGACGPYGADGSACVFSDDCLGGICANHVCETVTSAAIGQSCDVLTGGGRAFCNEGFCKPAPGQTSGTCTPYLALGATCGTAPNTQCGRGAICDSNSETCVAYPCDSPL